jgi:exodeoxyribonuclease-3
LKIATWNVNGFRAREAQFLEWVRRDAPDVVCLQEIKATPDQLGETLTMLPEYWSYWHGGPKGYSGVSLHVRKDAFPSKPEFSHPAFDVECRVVQARLDGGLVVASIYVPNGGKDFGAKLQFLEAMSAYVSGALAAGGRVVLCGDMNVARSDKDVTARDRNPAAIGQRPDERAIFERILASGMVDAARALDPETETTFTWWPPWRNLRQQNRGWRIDYVLASTGLRVTECKVLADVGTSDHAPVVAVLVDAPQRVEQKDQEDQEGEGLHPS